MTEWSLDPETIKPLVGCQSTALMSKLWPVISLKGCFSPIFQILSSLSSDAVTNFSSFGLMAKPRTASLWPCMLNMSVMDGEKYLMQPDVSVEMMNFPDFV